MKKGRGKERERQRGRKEEQIEKSGGERRKWKLEEGTQSEKNKVEGDEEHLVIHWRLLDMLCFEICRS